MKNGNSISILVSPFDVSKIKVIKRFKKKVDNKKVSFVEVQIIEGSLKGTKTVVLSEFLKDLSLYQEEHNKKYH